MQAVIIAAGESKRFWPLNAGMHKSQFKLLGKPLIYWTLAGLAENVVQDVMIVVSKESSLPEMLDKENDLGIKLTYATQEEPLGTGNAFWQAKDFVREQFILLWGNKVASRDIVKQMIAKQREEGAQAVFAGTEISNPQEYGIFRLEAGKLVEIVEKPEPGKEPSNIALAGIQLLQPDFLPAYEKLPRHHETDLVDAVNAYLKEKKTAWILLESKGLTLKYPWDSFHAMDFLFASDYFRPYSALSAKVASSVKRTGPVYIGKNTTVKEGTVIEGPAYIGDNCVIGYHNVLRGPLNIESNVKTGAYMEIKHSVVQEGTVFHSGYMGDSVVGKQCRFGAGFITGNVRLDRAPIHGFPKLGAIVGENSMFGIHSGTMPGIMIGANCKVGPGTLVFENLENNTTFYAKFDYVKKQ